MDASDRDSVVGGGRLAQPVAMTDTARLDAVALALAAGAQPARAAATLKSGCATWPVLPLGDGLAALGLDGPGARSHWLAEATRALEYAGRAGYDVCWPAHHRYPPLLGTIVDPPLLLWLRGDADVLAAPAVAVIGSRHSTMAAREVAHQLGADLAAAGVVVASGFARGVDAAAHRGALSTGRSLAVLGCGLDQPYPSDHGPLGQALSAAGLLVSEFPPGTPPRAHHFPLRNRTLSGICQAVVVVQAAQRSGSLITARLALEQGRDVMAVPGDVRGGAYAGSHALLRDGARLVERATDVLEEMGWSSAAAGGAATSAGAAALPHNTLVARLAREDGVGLDDLVYQTGRDCADLLRELLDLELAGRVRRDPAGRFMAVQRKW